MRIVSRRGVLGLAMAGLVAVPRLGRAMDAVPDAVMAPIRALNDALIGVMRAGKSAPFRARFHMLAPTIDRAFDLAGILLVSVGPRWAGIDAAQQTALMGVFRRFTVASYVDNFDSYADEQFEVAPDLRAIGADQVVSTTLVSTSDDPIRIDYVMRREGVAWKVVDVMLDGTISRVAVQRSDFRGVLTQGGAPALIASLERKVADLSGGALES
jgi:phospholipid transport system substrate-binding protein